MKIDFRFLKTFFLFCAIDSGNINCTVLFNLDFLCVLPEGRYQNEKTGMGMGILTKQEWGVSQIPLPCFYWFFLQVGMLQYDQK